MASSDTDNKTIAKNIAFLYIRMLLTLLISLYTSRVFLDALGVTDYGIYNAVGGVVGMLSFFYAALSGATSRFLTYELGSGDFERLRETFKAAFTLHSLLILFIVLLFETVGLYFINNELNVPSDRMTVVNIVYQLSVLSCAFQIISIPFNATIISHEKMNVFALIGILDAILKLIISFAIVYSPIDRLVFYSTLLLTITFLDALIYIIYCKKHFKECSLAFARDSSMLRPMLSYSGWDLFGNFSVVVRSQGLVILQNIFFGPIINAATAISNQVMSAVMGFAENFLTAIKPQIIKLYAQGAMIRFNRLVIRSSKYCFLLLFLISFPVLVEAKYILNLWLIDVPDYTVEFCQLSIINNWISILFRPITIAIGATGNIMRISFINGSIYLLVLPLSYVFLKMGGSPIVPFVLNIVLLFIGNSIFSMRIIKIQIPSFSLSLFFKKAVVPAVWVILISSILPFVLSFFLKYGLSKFLISFSSTLCWSALSIGMVALSKDEKLYLYSTLKLLLKKLRT